ncbi:MAG TPA: aspartate carbamoyltransferase catalytic subunit [Candidatus Krumholzibacteria bacterium]|nr:aspartate carbamoyltransferase catalytic subunit [Candidatus Krumholzibacteria bacterium]HRX51183.1 aspartate carbamoyltransferase catalytic subunit [Candidatus Krumholzibacteria bacterium]
MSMFGKDLIGLEDLSREQILTILDTADAFRSVFDRPVRKVPIMRGKTVVNLFFEPSTRTRISFELAEKRLSADIVNFDASTSSLKKGETLRDTAENIQAMKVDMIVMRHSSPGAAAYLGRVLKASVINAGDGAHEHPTQGLLDIMTMRQRLGNLEGKKVTIVGDISHSRVARSNIYGLTKLGAKVTVCGPPTMVPGAMAKLGADVELDLLKAVADADVINVLRIQLERQSQMVFPGNREYHLMYGVTADVMRRTKDSCFVMHPGPMNREVEISSEVADGPRQVILEQVTNGVAVRMAVIYLLSGGDPGNLRAGD